MRRNSEAAQIVLVERGPYISFANCGLPYHISGAIAEREQLLVTSAEAFHERYRVDVRVRTEAIAIPTLQASYSVDVTGWSLQSDSINLANAQVTVTDNGVDKPVTVTQLYANYGSRNALRFNPQGWTSQAGHTYRVSVTNISTPISYDVEVVDCP